MSERPSRYRSSEEDSQRWCGFPFRDGDIVISTRSKSGTTWMQMICALLVFQTPDLPGPLARLSPWLDWLLAPKDDVYAALEAQEHRRFIKTHTPLDGLPIEPNVTYIVVGRHPLDQALSLYHQSSNLDRSRISELTGSAPVTRPPRPVREWLESWIDSDPDPSEALDSLPGVMWHLRDAWARRDADNVLLVHFDDLLEDLPGQMRRLASRLHIQVAEGRWPSIVEAATFRQMKSRAGELVPDPFGVLKSSEAFFRSGSSGSAAAILGSAATRRYGERARHLAPPDLLAWLHGEVVVRPRSRLLDHRSA